MHYALRSGFGAAEIDLGIVKDSNACCDFEGREKEGDIFKSSKEDLNQDGDGHGGELYKDVLCVSKVSASRYQGVNVYILN